ncbi:SDR family NAD(P)-dependent oxidoreductase [Leucobacter massiliensis]|uniref:Short-chain dehydrogenase n=1 Tax=Leucobacter massiliensis TaxID=1686285 RepID=A0A2S9QQT9_9MICO|nr:SDR family NAD(P)-dependent oxidoreductase [Leucobacter massiliensis]PRI11945.1 short-chain dehydrogenase [Leucobacter massiliensis]
MRTDLTGRVALVTGATGGLGVAQVEALAGRGARVVAHARSTRQELTALTARTEALGLVKNLADPEQCRALVRETADAAGHLDILVANHATMTMAPLVDADPADWWRVVETNLLGTYALIQEAVRVMRAQGSGGRIVVIASEWGVIGWPEATAYAASKAGLISVVKCLGRELAGEGILVNAIAPGVVDTPQLAVDAAAADVTLDAMHTRYAAGIPLGRIGQPHEIAQAVLLLCDPELRAMAGQTVQVNGGSTRGRA